MKDGGEIISEYVVETRKLTKEFEVSVGILKARAKIRAVDEVSFGIKEGEQIALVGESGCGKSTLGRLLLGLLKPSSGQVLYKGRDIWHLSRKEFEEFRRNAQIIPQNPYDALNPAKKLSAALIPQILRHKMARGRDEARKIALDLLERVGLSPPEDFIERYPSRLSGGQMQRVVIARAISVKPQFVVADEAVSMLDASLRVEILDMLHKIGEELRTTFLLITHDLGVARYFAKNGKIAIMYLGDIVEVGETEETIRNPLHPYTKALLAAIPVPDPKIARERKSIPLKSIDVPSLLKPISGCKFHTRCPYATGDCEKIKPELRLISNRWVACHSP